MNALIGICRKSGVGAAALVTMLLAAPTHAADTPGETFVFDWTETSPNPSQHGSVDLTLGAKTSSGVFDISSFDVTSAGGFCGICTPALPLNLTDIHFDPTTNGVFGDIKGSYTQNKNGTIKTHTFTLETETGTLPSGLTWQFADTGLGGSTQTSMGTYTTSVAVTTGVDEPATILLVVPAAAGLGIALRRRRRAMTG